jgi:hypothetical protein
MDMQITARENSVTSIAHPTQHSVNIPNLHDMSQAGAVQYQVNSQNFEYNTTDDIYLPNLSETFPTIPSKNLSRYQVNRAKKKEEHLKKTEEERKKIEAEESRKRRQKYLKAKERKKHNTTNN